jgi:NAD(P)-dependent dehydrogenase (short-subunit alcohol dehydrogenase family)
VPTGCGSLPRVGTLGSSDTQTAGPVNLAPNYVSLLARSRIRVNCVLPTGVDTPMIRNDIVARHFAEAKPEDLSAFVNAILVRTIEADDVAKAVYWACSTESEFCMGNVLLIDAGPTLR